MTAFLSIHGYEIECSTLEQTFELVGNDRRRSASGTLRQTRIARKYGWKVELAILDPATVSPLMDLVTGEGHVWSFDADVFSSKGLGWSTTPTLDATNKKFGASSMSAASGTTYTASYTEATTRTVLLWRRPGSGSFDHYALVLTGNSVTTQYKNGVAGSYSVTNWITPASDGSFSLLGKNDAGTNTTVQYDDLVVLPFTVTQAMVTAWFGQTISWADLPSLNITTNDTTNHVAQGEPGPFKWVRCFSPLDGVFKPCIQFGFNLFEV